MNLGSGVLFDILEEHLKKRANKNDPSIKLGSWVNHLI